MNNCVSQIPRINQQIVDSQKVRDISLTVAIPALSLSGLALSGSTTASLVSCGVVGCSLLALTGSQMIVTQVVT